MLAAEICYGTTFSKDTGLSSNETEFPRISHFNKYNPADAKSLYRYISL